MYTLLYRKVHSGESYARSFSISTSRPLDSHIALILYHQIAAGKDVPNGNRFYLGFSTMTPYFDGQEC